MSATHDVSFHTFRAMNTDIRLWLDAKPDIAERAFQEAVSLFRDVEDALSRFSPYSELSRLNAAAGEWVRVSKMLWEITLLSLDYAEETGGIFDPTILNAVRAAGYAQSFDEIGSGAVVAGSDSQPAALIGRWQDIELNYSARAIRLPAGTGLDFGGIGKGYTAKWAAQLLSMWGPCMVEAGGDVMTSGAPGQLDGWPVGIRPPRIDGIVPDQNMVLLALTDEALATSGIDHRRWIKAGKSAHHIIDPRTGQPVETDLLTISVLTDSSVSAEIWTKVGMIMGLDALTEQNIPALIVDQNREVVANELMHKRIRWQHSDFNISVSTRHAIIEGELT